MSVLDQRHFQLPTDDGRRYGSPQPENGRSFRDGAEMTGIVRLTARVAQRGHEVLHEIPWARTKDERARGPWLAPRGIFERPPAVRWRTYSAELLQHSIFVELANTPKTHEGIVEFADKWGLPDDLRHPRSCYSTVCDMYAAIDEISEALEIGRSGGDGAIVRRLQTASSNSPMYPRMDLGFLGIVFGWERRADRRNDKPRLFLEANNLFQFCLLEHLQALAGGVDINSCGHCRTYLRIQKNGRPAKYCTDACRQAACRARRK